MPGKITSSSWLLSFLFNAVIVFSFTNNSKELLVNSIGDLYITCTHTVKDFVNYLPVRLLRTFMS
jgi:hypothetical protein